MNQQQRRRGPPMPFAGSELDESRHVCAFFHNDDEAYRVLLPFIRDGFICGDKAVHLVNPGQEDLHLQRLATAGIDPSEATARGQLELRTNAEAYLRDGRFDPDRMLEAFERLASGHDPRGFPRSRIVCRMDWAAGDRAATDQLVEFESRVNAIWSRHDDAVICVYRLDQFGGDTVVDILRTHPMVIVGGTLQVNPFFVPPDTFLEELRGRRATPAGARAPVE